MNGLPNSSAKARARAESPRPPDDDGSATAPRASSEFLAGLISQVGSPPLLLSAGIVALASRLGRADAWDYAGLLILLTVVTPMLHLAWLCGRGEVADLEVQRREERIKPMLFSTLCGGLAWLLLALGNAPVGMALVAGALWVQSVAILGITLRWKISVHSATAAAMGTLVWFVLGTPLLLALGVPAVAWARVRLGRHSPAQTVAGALLGVLVFGVALSGVDQGRGIGSALLSKILS